MLRALTVGILAACLIPLTVSPVSGTTAPEPVKLLPGAGNESNEVRLEPRDPGQGGDSSGGTPSAAPVARKSQGERVCRSQGDPVECTTVWGVWWQDQRCWIKRMSPQPELGLPIWGGRTDGAIYWCQPPASPSAIGGGHMAWVPPAGTPGSPLLVDPVTLAEEAIERMNLHAIDVGITPPEGPDSYTLLGLPTWLWVEEPSPTTWGPITETASAGSVTVSATARVNSFVWDMGDGTRKSCGKGTPYDRSFDAAPSPTCGHTYDSPGRYPVTATSNWTVEWAGAGQSGTITFTLTRGASVWVRQAHGLLSRQG